MPEVDSATTGGAVDFSCKIAFNDITPSGLIDYVSSSASDTATTLAVTGRDATGVLVTETKTLTGTTLVNGSQSFERLMKTVKGGTTAVGDIAAIAHTATLSGRTAQAGSAQSTGVTPPLLKLQAGDGAARALGEIIRITSGTGAGQLRQIVGLPAAYGTDFVAVNRDWGTLPDNTSVYSIHQGMLLDLSPNQITTCRRPYYGVSSDVAGGSSRDFYEKIFVVNDNTATAWTAAQVIKQVDPGTGVLQFALCNALNDTATVANRQTAPASGITAFSSGSAPQTINVPSPQNLPSGAAPNSAGAQGVWLKLTLSAALAPAKTSFTMRANGNTV